jgi:hypothetical protein
MTIPARARLRTFALKIAATPPIQQSRFGYTSAGAGAPVGGALWPVHVTVETCLGSEGIGDAVLLAVRGDLLTDPVDLRNVAAVFRAGRPIRQPDAVRVHQ